MDEWMGGWWVDGWMGGRMDGWMEKQEPVEVGPLSWQPCCPNLQVSQLAQLWLMKAVS